MNEIALPVRVFTEKDVSFRILNQDNLPLTMIEDRKFKPFGFENLKRKPNGIVYPTRRIDLGNVHDIISDTQVNLPSFQENSNHATFASSNNFAKNLDAKLRKLQNENQRFETSRKPFITTVKQGAFLEAPEVTKTLESDKKDTENKSEACKKESVAQLYAYVSKPTVLCRSPPQNVHRSRCEAAAIAAGVEFSKDSLEKSTPHHHKIKKRDVSKEMSPDKRIAREKNRTTKLNEKSNLPQWNPYFAYAKLLSQEDHQSREARAEISKRRATARRKAKLQFDRNSQLRENFESVKKHSNHIGIQTDVYLQASLAKPPIININTQTDPEIFFEKVNSLTQSKIDEAVQIIPEDLFDFEDELQSVLENLVGKTIENALIEILEEEELAALKEQHRRFLEIRAEEQKQAKEFLEKHFIEKIDKKNISLSLEKYLTKLLPQILDDLKKEDLSPQEHHLDDDAFLPWLLEEVTMELGDILSSEDVLLGIVRDVMKRHKEIDRLMDSPEETDAIYDV